MGRHAAHCLPGAVPGVSRDYLTSLGGPKDKLPANKSDTEKPGSVSHFSLPSSSLVYCEQSTGNWKSKPRGSKFKMLGATAVYEGTSELILNKQVKGETSPD